MRKRLTSLALILAIAGGIYAGMPLHSSEQECSMPEMEGMECCQKAAQANSATAEGLLARLCCAFNCPQTGSSGSERTQVPRPSVAQITAAHPSWTQPSADGLGNSPGSVWSHGPPGVSRPAYLRHLALLI
ncbi:MAG TPA: hypothetical protein VKD91_20890 [Pyrinomonadaceae bacterium]|nr:hypothetical protein [Pyrinomonadaceae bacterium]